LNDEIPTPAPPPPARAIDWPAVVVTLLVGAAAFGLIAAQFSWAHNPTNQYSLANLDARVPLLESTTNWVQREQYCVPFAHFARDLDSRLRPNARVFITGIVGSTNMSHAGFYFYLKNYLFPRDVEISLDGKSIIGNDRFYGVPCSSTNVLKANGFDMMIKFSNSMQQVITLTSNGVLAPE
jgi:hypothetical protein